MKCFFFEHGDSWHLSPIAIQSQLYISHFQSRWLNWRIFERFGCCWILNRPVYIQIWLRQNRILRHLKLVSAALQMAVSALWIRSTFWLIIVILESVWIIDTFKHLAYSCSIGWVIRVLVRWHHRDPDMWWYIILPWWTEFQLACNLLIPLTECGNLLFHGW